MPVVAAAVPHPPIILPEIGKGEEEKIKRTQLAYTDAMRFIGQYRPQAVVVISPHTQVYPDAFHISFAKRAWGDFARFGAPTAAVDVDCDPAFARAIAYQAEKMGLPVKNSDGPHAELDHGTLIPLVYLLREFPGVKLVSIGISGLSLEDHYRLGQCIAKASQDSNIAIIGSGDLSHKLKEDGPYGFAPQGPVLDGVICDALSKGDFAALMGIDPDLAEQGAECGLRSFVVMAGAMDGQPVEASLLSYEGTFGVGYAVATFRPFGADNKRCFLAEKEGQTRRAHLERQKKEDTYVSLARFAIETRIFSNAPAKLPGGIPAELRENTAGVFVSLHKNGDLRGCIGTLAPTTNCVGEEILQNAVSAAFEDPRFPPVRQEELDLLEINVDVLGKPEVVDSEDALDVRRYGVIITSGAKRGLLLPDLEGVDTVDEQVDIACRKAGILPGEDVRLERFEVVRHR